MTRKPKELGDIVSELIKLLQPLEPVEQTRALEAARAALGLSTSSTNVKSESHNGSSVNTGASSPSKFFAEKGPKNKGEELAVAARYRELHENAETHGKADLKIVIDKARRNFDKVNFLRDINNAKRQARFFTIGGGRDQHSLSHYGQQYVDSLPNREAADKLPKPRTGAARPRKKRIKPH